MCVCVCVCVYPVRIRLMFTCVLGRYAASTVLLVPTLRASLSGTFLKTLPDLELRHRRGTLYLRAAVHRRGHPPLVPKLQALVYDILPLTAAVFSYAIGSRKLLANEQFFFGAQTVVSLLQTTQIKQGVSFIAVNKVYTSPNKTAIV